MNQECVYGSSRRKRREEYQSMVIDKVAEANEHWQQMKKHNDGNSTGHMQIVKGPCSHKETLWWNEEVAEAVRKNKKKYGKW